METVSEKPKRGRPKVHDDTSISFFSSLFPGRTNRHLQNIAYRSRAIHLLCSDPEFAWLGESEKMMAGGNCKWKPTILCELGRIQNDEDLRSIARQICRLKPKTSEAVAIIRRWRIGKSNPPNCLTLTNQLVRVLNDYVASHPVTTKDQLRMALVNCMDLLDDDCEP